MAIKIISDTHFLHKHIIAYSDRIDICSTLEEMEDIIVERWNSVVSEEDTVYFLGDFAFGGSKEITRLVSRLNGRIIIVKGNHDPNKSQRWYLDKGFYAYYAHPIILDNWYILSHEPIGYVSDKMPYVNIHGHTHEECFDNPQRVNVSWDNIDGYPVDFEVIKARFAAEFDEYDNLHYAFKRSRHDGAGMIAKENYQKGYVDGYKRKQRNLKQGK